MLDVGYSYYANGWLKKVEENSDPVAKYTYDIVGNRTRVDLGNGAYTTYDYSAADPRYFVDEIGHYDPSDQELGTISYTQRDASGNPSTIDEDPRPILPEPVGADQRIRHTMTLASQATPAASSFPSGEKSTDTTLSMILTFRCQRIRPVHASDIVMAPPTSPLGVGLRRAGIRGSGGTGFAVPPTAMSFPSGEKASAHGEPIFLQSTNARSRFPV